MQQANFPHGWDQKRVNAVIQHYEEQTEDEALAEDVAAFQKPDQTVMKIPIDLVNTVREMTARHKVAA